MKFRSILLFFSFCCLSQLKAQVVNDDCVNATSITMSNTCSYTTGTLQGANIYGTSNGCNGYFDVYYKFIATQNAATITVVGSSGLDLVVGLYSSCSISSPMNCVDVSYTGGTEIINAAALIIGQTYYIKVQNYYSTLSATYTFNICVKAVQPPVNDICTNATILYPGIQCTTVAGTLQSAQTNTTPSGCIGNSDVFYKFVANSTEANITVTPSSGIDLVLAVFDNCSASTSLYCRDFYISGQSESIDMSSLVIGQTYYIKVQHYGTSLPTTYSFSVCLKALNVSTPSNDDCTNAIGLTPSSTCSSITSTVAFANTSTSPAGCTGNTDIFYKFIANNPTATITVNSSSGLNPVVSVFNSCTASSSIKCIDNTYDGGQENVSLTNLTIGNTYYIKVAQYGSTLPSTNSFDLCLVSNPPAPPVNDHCSDALVLTPSTVCNNTSGTLLFATTSTSNILDNCNGNSDVYYKFVADATTAAIKVTLSDGIDGVIGVYASCSTSSMECIDDGFVPGGIESRIVNGLVPGNTYYIKVQDFGTALPSSYDFDICIISTPTTSIQSISALKSISIFPNPATSHVTISKITESTRIEMIDVSGNVLWKNEISGDITIDIIDFPAGIYLLKLIRDDFSDTRRIVVVK